MINFKILVKVSPDRPYDALKVLGQNVVGDKNAFVTADPTWVTQQDFITVVPIEVALTVEMRAVIQANSPETRFIVTGVTSQNVSNLINDFGYVVFPGIEDFIDKEPDKENDPDETEEVKPKDDKDKVQPTAGQETDGKRCFYWINGKEVSREEFNKKASKLEAMFNEFLDKSQLDRLIG